jgi:hypothetical protein
MAAQINSFVEQAKLESGPEAGELGAQLLEADEAALRVAGGAVLAETGALDEEALAHMAGDEDASVPVNVLGWLMDNGYGEQAHALAGLIRIDGRALVDLLVSDALNGAGSRAALDLASAMLSPEDAMDTYLDVAATETQDYSARMKAAMLLRDTMDFESYRDEIGNMKTASSAEDPVWQEGIARLAQSLEGPIPVHTGPATLTPSDVDQLLAREYPMSIEDLALRIEYVMGQDNAYVQPGTALRLQEHVVELEKRPWTEEQKMSLTRLNTLAEELPAFETEGQAPGNVPEPPPGAMSE